MPISEPTRDRDGNVQPHDHPDIIDEAGLLRYVHPDHWIEDRNAGNWRLTSGAFKDDNGTSVGLETLLQESGKPSTHRLLRGYGLIRLRAGDARSLETWVGWNPVRDRGPGLSNEYHCQIWGIAGESKSKKKSRAREFREMCEWTVRISK